jgi:hypothetical protein
VESIAAPQQIAFAPAVTPCTFTDEPSVENAEPAPSLFPSNLEGSGPKKPGHGKKKAEDHIPRPPNAFILFRSSFIKSRHVSTEVETNHSTLSKIIGLTWQNMPHEERQFWHSKAKIAQAEHKRKFPDYAFRPSHVKAKGATEKRKVREVGPKDMKRCAKIAQLLVEGKKGADLQAAIEEFDRSHVPTVVTRFDTPITARSFRRSLSEPAPDLDPSAPAFLRADSKPSSRRLRASSSQPTLSRPSTPKTEESAFSSISSASSVFSSSPFANLAENADTPSDTTWSDMPPLVLPPVGFVDHSFVTKDAPSLVSVMCFLFVCLSSLMAKCCSSSRASTHSFFKKRLRHALNLLLIPSAPHLTLNCMLRSTQRIRRHAPLDPLRLHFRSICRSWSRRGRVHRFPVRPVRQSVTQEDHFRQQRRCRHRLLPRSISTTR